MIYKAHGWALPWFISTWKIAFCMSGATIGQLHVILVHFLRNRGNFTAWRKGLLCSGPWRLEAGYNTSGGL